MIARKHVDLDSAYLVYRMTGRDEDLERVVTTGRNLVCHFARIFTGGTSEDAVQAGMEGLMKAVVRFDPVTGASFGTYAAHCVMGEIRHYIRKESSYYRPGSIKDLQFKVDRFVEEVLKETGIVPAIQEIAAALNVKEEGVVQAMRAGLVSLEDVEVKKIRAERYEAFKLPIEDKILLQQAFKKLSDLQKRVIYYLFFRDLTQIQTAEKLGITQRKVSRVLHKSLKQMEKTFKS
jgi:RNA polymerase sigma-B factor